MADSDVAPVEGEEELSKAYHVVYAGSLVVVAVGGLVQLSNRFSWMSTSETPFLLGLVWEFLSVGLVATGAFLLVNSDLVVTYYRISQGVNEFKANNEAFGESLEKQGAEVQKLGRAAAGFKRLDEEFSGSVEKLQEVVEDMEATSTSQLKRSVLQLCRLYCDQDRDRLIEPGEELEETLATLRSVLGAFFKDIRAREAALSEALQADEKFIENGGVRVRIFADIYAASLEGEVGEISEKVKEIMAEA